MGFPIPVRWHLNIESGPYVEQHNKTLTCTEFDGFDKKAQECQMDGLIKWSIVRMFNEAVPS